MSRCSLDQGIGCRTAFDLLLEELGEKATLKTSCNFFDKFLYAGIKTKSISEISGCPGTGKTALCMAFSVEVTLQESDFEVIYIGTGNGCLKEKFLQLANYAAIKRNKENRARNIEGQDVDPAQMLKRIHYVKCKSELQLIRLSRYFCGCRWQSSRIRLIVVDCFGHVFRDNTTSGRIRKLYMVLHNLQQVANKVNCALVITNEMTTRIYKKTGQKKISVVFPALNDSFYHRIHQRIMLRKPSFTSNSSVVMVHIQKNYFFANPIFLLNISQNGIKYLQKNNII